MGSLSDVCIRNDCIFNLYLDLFVILSKISIEIVNVYCIIVCLPILFYYADEEMWGNGSQTPFFPGTNVKGRFVDLNKVCNK